MARTLHRPKGPSIGMPFQRRKGGHAGTDRGENRAESRQTGCAIRTAFQGAGPGEVRTVRKIITGRAAP